MTTPGPDDPDYGDYLDYLQVAAWEAWLENGQNAAMLAQDEHEAEWESLLEAVDSGAYEYLDDEDLDPEIAPYFEDLTPEEAEHVRSTAGEPGWIPSQRMPGH